MNISKWALANSKLVYFFVAILIVGGIIAYDNMSKLEDPEIKVKQAVIVTVFPGASPHEVELQVTEQLEKAIYSMKGIKDVESRSYADMSMIQVNLATTIKDEEVEQYWDILRRKINDVQSSLPSEAKSSLVIDDYGDVFGMFYALSSDGYSNEELSSYADLVKREIQTIEGISKVELYGEFSSVINILIDREKMSQLGVLPVEVIQTLNGQNNTVYSGYYGSGYQRIRIEVNDKYKNIEDIENLVIKGHQGDQMLLKDIATVERDYSAPIRNSMSYDQRSAIGISISALSGTDITKIGKQVEDKVNEITIERLPVGIEFNKVFIQPERVTESISTFLLNLLSSVLIVIVVLMFTMGFRSGLLLGSTLAITVVGSLLILNLFNGTLQRVSLASFILAMGMLVDNAIVIVDGILIDLKKGRLRSKALTNIGKKTAMPLLGATLIAILAFAPLFLSPDTAGVYIRDLFIVLAVSLLLSWILSLTLVPLQAKSMLKPSKNKKKDSKLNLAMLKGLKSVLTWGLKHRVTAILIALILCFGSVLLYKQLPQSFFPDMNYNQLYIEYKLDEGTSSEQTKEDLDEITEYLLSYDGVTHVTASVGATPSRYNLVRSIGTPSLSYGDIIVEFTSSEAAVQAITNLQAHLSANYPQAYARVKRYNLMYNKYPIEAKFSGPDPAVLRDLTKQAQAIMESNSKITLVNSDWERKVPVLEVDYNQAVARELGISRQDIALSLLASSDGIPAGTIFQGDDSETLIIKCVDTNGEPIEDLNNAPIFTLMPSIANLNVETLQALMRGMISEEEVVADILSTTPLSESIKSIKLKWEDPIIVRYNGERAMSAQCNTLPGVGAEDARSEIKDEIEAIELPTGYSMVWKGEYSSSNESLKYLFGNLPLAVVLMIAILIMLFKDYRKPLIIFISVPLLFVGAVLGVWVSGKAFGFVAICGILGLIGMMIKNGVVLMDEINLEIKNGKEPIKAILDSSASRFRPVMMASLTTILGMIPLLPDDMFGSLAATIMGGLLVGTIVTLIFIPILYAMFFGIKVNSKC